MIDLHIHSLLSDGELIAAELCAYAKAKGLKYVTIVDHVDYSNIEYVLGRLINFKKNFKDEGINIKVGVELTYIKPNDIKKFSEMARGMGADCVVVHGEAIFEPQTVKGTNIAAIEAGVDTLAHPGFITKQELIAAKENNVALEITARYPYCLANGYLMKVANEFGSINLVVFGSDAHKASEILEPWKIELIIKGAGGQPEVIFDNALKWWQKR